MVKIVPDGFPGIITDSARPLYGVRGVWSWGQFSEAGVRVGISVTEQAPDFIVSQSTVLSVEAEYIGYIFSGSHGIWIPTYSLEVLL